MDSYSNSVPHQDKPGSTAQAFADLPTADAASAWEAGR